MARAGLEKSKTSALTDNNFIIGLSPVGLVDIGGVMVVLFAVCRLIF
jgi:hypothetical protein